MLKIRPGSYANVASTAALVIGLAGTSYAAGLVTSAQIADGTIRNRDIHSETITGATIRDGSVSESDLAADTRSVAYSTYHDAEVAISPSSVETVLSLTVPRSGAYVVNAKLEGRLAGAAPSSWISCGIAGGTDVDYTVSSLPASGDAIGVPFQFVHEFNAGQTADLRCTAGSAGVTAKDIKITAVSVDELTNTPG